MDEDSKMASFLAQTSPFELCGFFLAFIGWCFCISSVSLGQWRQWYIENTTEFQSGVMWIGIWDVCYDTNPSDSSDYFDITCKPLEGANNFLPKEIYIAQDLMSLCAVVETLAIGFVFFAYWNSIKNGNKMGITVNFFNIGGFLNISSGIMVLVPVTWNMVSVLNNKTIKFPASFNMPSHPKRQQVGLAIHLGFASAILQIVSGFLFLSNKCWLMHKKTHPLDLGNESESSSVKDFENCPHCGSSLTIDTSSHYTSFCEGIREKKMHGKPEVTFQIPMGPIPDQRVTRSDTKAFSIEGESAYF